MEKHFETIVTTAVVLTLIISFSILIKSCNENSIKEDIVVHQNQSKKIILEIQNRPKVIVACKTACEPNGVREIDDLHGKCVCD